MLQQKLKPAELKLSGDDVLLKKQKEEGALKRNGEKLRSCVVRLKL